MIVLDFYSLSFESVSFDFGSGTHAITAYEL